MANPQAIVADVAHRFLGVREVTKNRSPEIAKFWDYTNYQEGDENREPWCCAAVVAWIQMADAESKEFNIAKPPKTASVAEFLRWVKDPKNGCQIVERPTKGDIAIMLPKLSHIGVVAEDYDGDGTVELIEGNTNKAGSREGDGVYQKSRNINFPGYYVRLPIVPKRLT